MRRSDVVFIACLWAATRLIILGTFFSEFGNLRFALGHLASFDGAWFGAIATSGYQYEPDHAAHNIAFFPLYPMAVWLVWRAGVPVDLASLLVSNFAFVAALLVAFVWVRRRCNTATARWTIVTLCCCPLSLFASAGYSESLFLFVSSTALLGSERMRFGVAALFGALASATRLIGIALIPAFLLTALIDPKRRSAWLPALGTAAGVGAFSAYCAARFGDPLAFVHAQSAWRQAGPRFDMADWQFLVVHGITASLGWHALALAGAVVLWLAGRRLPLPLQLVPALCIAGAERWAWNGSEYVALLALLAPLLAIRFHSELGATAFFYFFAGLTIIAATGVPVSADRFAYALLPCTVSLALLWRRVPALGVVTAIVMAVDLYFYCRTFALGGFVA